MGQLDHPDHQDHQLDHPEEQDQLDHPDHQDHWEPQPHHHLHHHHHHAQQSVSKPVSQHAHQHAAHRRNIKHNNTSIIGWIFALSAIASYFRDHEITHQWLCAYNTDYFYKDIFI